MTNPPFKPEDLTESLREAIGEAVSGATHWWTASLENLPKPFGHTQLTGANPQKDALLAYAAISYFNSHGDFSGETEEERTSREALLQQAAQLAAQAFEEARTASHAESIGFVSRFGEALADKDSSLEEAAKKFASDNGISLSNDDLAELDTLYQKLLAEEARQRDAAIANAAAAAAASESTYGPTIANAESAPNKLMNDETKAQMLASVDAVFDAGAASGYPAVSDRQRLLTKAIVMTEATWLQKRWDLLDKDGHENSYLITETVYSGFEYGGAAIGTGSAAISAAYDAYQNAGGEWTQEQWQETLETKAGAVWTELSDTIGTEGADQFKAASEAIDDHLIARLADNAASDFNASAQFNNRSGFKLPTDTLQLIYDQDKELYAQLVGDINTPPDKAEVTLGQLCDLIEPETRQYSSALFLTDQGPANQVPISRSMVLAGESPIAAIYAASGKTYPIGQYGPVPASLSVVDNWSNEPAHSAPTITGGEEAAQTYEHKIPYTLAQQQQRSAHSIA